MDRLQLLFAHYTREVAALAASASSTEPTYYPALQSLLNGILRHSGLPFNVRTNTSETREDGGTDRPDLAFYDGTGDFAVVLGEVKTPGGEIAALAQSTARNDQIGRYLAQTGVVLLVNVRAFGLLTVDPDFSATGAVPPQSRRLGEVVELWPSVTALSRGAAPPEVAMEALVDLVEVAVTEFAPISEPESLARILARLARRAKAALPAQFSRAVQPLLDDFAAALGIHFVDEDGQEFLRSSLIQTAFYGLFAGWTLWRHSGAPSGFRWESLSEYLKIPFLGELFYEFRHPTRMKELGLAQHLDRAQAALERVEPERFFSRFGLPHVVAEDSERAVASNAILYFYEPFLEAFDPELRRQLGVWYTPHEIVRYQVRKVDRLLREDLDCRRGFADDRVVVLDPCCGTGAYLIEVLRCVAEQLEEEGAGALLGGRLLDAFCRRILGFEILTAPFVIAQLQLYLILSDLGVEPDVEHRPAVFLTNALVGWEGPEQLKLQFPELQEEHEAARRVKREEKIIVILGNPPYNRFAGAPIDEEADLVDHYKGIRRDVKGRQIGQSELYRRFRVRKHLLDDLYVRFLRLAEARIGERAEYGVVSFISNSSYLNGLSHPLMRESLLKNFSAVWIDNLHGNRLASERTPWGDSCETIFHTQESGPGIKVGTCISTFLKRRDKMPSPDRAVVQSRDFWGRARLKRQALLSSLDMGAQSPQKLEEASKRPEGPRAYETIEVFAGNNWRLVPWSTTGGIESWVGLDELFTVFFQGVNPNRGLNGSVIDMDREALAKRMNTYFSDIPFHELEQISPELCKPRARYAPRALRDEIRKLTSFKEEMVRRYLLFPLDARYIYYETEAKLLNERRLELWHNLQDNLFLVTVPQARRVSESRPLTTSVLFDLHVHDRGAVGIPVHFRPTASQGDLFLPPPNGGAPRANLAQPAWATLKETWSLDGDLDGQAARDIARQLIFFAVGIGHSPKYEKDHQDVLRHDWIHLPIPKKRETLAEITALGKSAARLLDPLAEPAAILERCLGDDRKHLGVVTTEKPTDTVRNESDLVITFSYYAGAKGRWEERPPKPSESTRAAWGVTTGDLYLNEKVYLRNVPERVWHYELGGYPVLKKWLGYRDDRRRPDRGLSLDEADHLRGMVHRLAALLVLHDELDHAYERALEDAFTAEDLGVRR